MSAVVAAVWLVFFLYLHTARGRGVGGADVAAQDGDRNLTIGHNLSNIWASCCPSLAPIVVAPSENRTGVLLCSCVWTEAAWPSGHTDYWFLAPSPGVRSDKRYLSEEPVLLRKEGDHLYVGSHIRFLFQTPTDIESVGVRNWTRVGHAPIAWLYDIEWRTPNITVGPRAQEAAPDSKLVMLLGLMGVALTLALIVVFYTTSRLDEARARQLTRWRRKQQQTRSFQLSVTYTKSNV